MAKHRKPSTVARPVRSVLVASALTTGAIAIPAAPAFAAPVTIPGVGTFEVPDQILAAIPQLPPLPALPQIAPPAPQTSSVAQRAVAAAESKVGAPYVYGAQGPNAFDCSGLVKWAYAQAGMQLPRTSYDQAAAGTPVSLSDLRPGDVVSFYDGSHSGLYVGGGNVVHASTTGVPVKVVPLASMPADGARRYA